MTDDQIKHMVSRFLGWKLPDGFRPDGGISFRRLMADGFSYYPMPVGTNLLDADQAEEMVRFMVEGLSGRETGRPEAMGLLRVAQTQMDAALARGGEAAKVPRAVVWLVEWPQSDNLPARWWHPETGWMMDANKALWFAREKDAADFAKAQRGFPATIASEHVFLAPAPLPTPGTTLDQTEAAPAPGREEIARIIDPSAWTTLDMLYAELVQRGGKPNPARFKDGWSLDKADAILALFHAPAEAGGGEDEGAVRTAGAKLLTALERYGFPVSDAASTAAMSVEARDLHNAARRFKIAITSIMRPADEPAVTNGQ